MNSYNDVLDELQNYILNDENIQKSIRMKIYQSNSKNEKPEKTNTKRGVSKSTDFFVPNEQDTLFWCFFIIKNGILNYETLTNKNSLIAKQLKIDLVSIIRKNKTTLKTYKFDTITNIESNLANDNNINIKTFLSLCAIENINIIYVCKKTYYELLMNDSNTIYIVNEIETQSKYYNKYGFELANEETLNSIRSSLYKLETVNKYIKAISSYNTQEIIDICNKLAIEVTNNETGKKKSKKELYESIIQYF